MSDFQKIFSKYRSLVVFVSLIMITAGYFSEVFTDKYNDGLYISNGQYQVPSGDINIIRVQIQLRNDTIEHLKVIDEQSVEYSKPGFAKFESAIYGEVVGRKLDQAEVSRLNGASLTSIGFNKAITSIRNQAKRP